MPNINQNIIISPIENPSNRISQIKKDNILTVIDVIDSGPIISPIRIEKKSMKKRSHLSDNNVDPVIAYVKSQSHIKKIKPDKSL